MEIKAGLCLSFSLLLRLVKQKADHFVDGAEHYDVMKKLNVMTDDRVNECVNESDEV